MALKTQHSDTLQASWDGSGLSLWAFDDDKVANHVELRVLASIVFGYHGLALLGPRVTPLYIPAPGEPEHAGTSGRRATHAHTMQAFDRNDAEFLRRGQRLDELSPSIRWLFAAFDLATLAARSGLVAPGLAETARPEVARKYPSAAQNGEADGQPQWEAKWKLRYSRELERGIERLDRQAPPSLWAPFPGTPPPSASRDVVAHLADGAARGALQRSSWRADLPRSNRADMVVARRFAAALRDEPTVGTSNRAANTAAASLAVSLGERLASVDAGVDFRCRARLRTPEASPDTVDKTVDEPSTEVEGDQGSAAEQPWKVTFEIVLVNDPTITFEWADLAAGRIQPSATPSSQDVSANALSPNTLSPNTLSVFATHIRSVADRLAEQIPEFGSLTPERGEVSLDIDSVSSLLTDGAERCATLGCALLVPKELARRRVRVSGTAKVEADGGVSANLGQTMIDVDWNVAVGDQRLTEDEIATLGQSKSDLIKLRGSWVRIDAGNAAAAVEQLQQRRSQSSLSPADLLRLAATSEAELAAAGTAAGADQADPGDEGLDRELELLIETEEGTQAADNWLSDLLEGLPDERLTEAEEPDGFTGTLRPYQRRAVGWLAFLRRLGLGGCLADDMGLGKTPTTLAHLLAHEDDRASLVICPLSVVHNWQAEAEKFTPKIRVTIFHGPNRPKSEEFAELLGEVDLVVTTYGTLSRDVETMASHEWNIVVCDEAQAIKNHRTKAARAVRALGCQQLVALTGTPVENRLAELWSILDAANPGSLGGIGWFRETFATPIETKGDEGALAGMKRLTGPFVLRRTKADKSLVPDLPDKVEQVAWAHLTEEQAGLYKAVLDDFLAQLERAEESAENEKRNGSKGDTGGNAMQRRGLVVATLTRLKQICNHPAQFLAAGGKEEWGALAGRSGKLNRFDELVAELLDADQRALIFTQYRTMGDILASHLAETHKIEANFLHGGVSRSARERMVADFQSGDSAPLQLVSLKAGGTGLNLTAASRVIHYDRWWNPAVEDQATDRAWRIGQQSTVFVHKLVCRGTLEERIDSLLRDKKALADSVVGTGEGWLTEMSTDELRGLFRLGASATGQTIDPGNDDVAAGRPAR